VISKAKLPGGSFNWTHKLLLDDAGFKTWRVETRCVAVAILLAPERTSEGYFQLRRSVLDDYAALLGVDHEGVTRALAELHDAGFASYDEDATMILIHKALKYQAPYGSKSITGAIATVDRAPRSADLWEEFLEAAAHYAPEFALALRSFYSQ
jgi:hypothetical protein